ncbi:hypothetical protein NE236_00260 [Actinoallomurus purpureus]|uniref:hypothetical protein n=1 Tax=Actinoallomurus purpureus TaxID=478114 RepID=UPI00209240D2|nr:hypothetical protein [Actinoallomurus purpureus]MCO6003408.1 hypothetical protein [Actinoallomurus purpureus]
MRPRGRVRGDAVAVLAGRVFAHTRPSDASDLVALIGADDGGLVLTGANPVRAARRCRDEQAFGGPILFDLAAAEGKIATRERPFDENGDRLVETTLEERVQGQIDAGADAALTPTLYLRAGEFGAVEAAVEGAVGLGRDDVILSLPMDAGWLARGLIDKVIGLLAGVPIPKAIMLGGQFNPPQRVMDGVLGLRRLVTEVPNVALFRTDLAGLDAMAQGSLAASIGTSSALRHVVPPGEAAVYGRANGGRDDRSPSVLVPDLLSYVRGSVLADRFGDRPAPLCRCARCGGRSIVSFLRQEDWRDARLHGVAVWTQWARNLLYPDSLAGRRRYWRQLCREAIAAHARYNTLVRAREPVFTPPESLWIWAGEDTAPTTAGAAVPVRPR